MQRLIPQRYRIIYVSFNFPRDKFAKFLENWFFFSLLRESFYIFYVFSEYEHLYIVQCYNVHFPAILIITNFPFCPVDRLSLMRFFQGPSISIWSAKFTPTSPLLVLFYFYFISINHENAQVFLQKYISNGKKSIYRGQSYF